MIVRSRNTSSKDRPTKKHKDKRTQSIKYKYLVSYLSYKKRILKIGLSEPSEVETDPLKTDGPKIVQTDGHSGFNIGIWCDTFQTKKRILKIGLLERNM